MYFLKALHFFGGCKYCRNFCVTCCNLMQKKYRQKADALKFTSVADSSQIKHAKKSQELQSDVSPWLNLSLCKQLNHNVVIPEIQTLGWWVEENPVMKHFWMWNFLRFISKGFYLFDKFSHWILWTRTITTKINRQWEWKYTSEASQEWC